MTTPAGSPERPLPERVLRRRSLGQSYPEIAVQERITEDQARAAGAEALDGRAAGLEAADQAAALALERLEAMERRAQLVMQHAADRSDDTMVLRAIDRLVLIDERRTAVTPAGAAGPVEDAVRAGLDAYPRRLRDSAAARVAVSLARRIDAGVATADMTALARELRVTLDELSRLAPPERENSKVDELRDRRADRERERQAAVAAAGKETS